MLEDHLLFEQSHTEFDNKPPQWRDSWSFDIDLEIVPLDEMDYQGRSSLPPLSLSLDRTVPSELQSLDSQRRTPHSPIGPVPWTTNFSGPGPYSSPSGPYYGGYRRPSPPDLKTPVDGRYSQSWHGPVDMEGSTIDPMSPRTPGARSEVDFQVGTLWPGVQGSLPYPPALHMDGKQNPPYPHAGGSGFSGLNGDEGGRQFPKEYIHLPPPNTTTLVFTQQQFPDPHQQNHHLGHAGSPRTLSPNLIRTPYDSAEDPPSEDEDAICDDQDDAASEYHPYQSRPSQPQHSLPRPPNAARRPATRARGSRSSNQRGQPLKPLPSNHRVHKPTRPLLSTSRTTFSPTRAVTLTSSPTTSKPHCPHCSHAFSSTISLKKHISKSHTRPFSCIFHRYGCGQVFGAKNEWARHIRVQHLCLESWACDVGKCGNNNAASGSEGAGHVFERKDLFIQHLRRMHSEIFASAGTGNADADAEKSKIEADKQERCHTRLRDLPPGGTCAYCPHQPLPLTASGSGKSGSTVKAEDDQSQQQQSEGVGYVKGWEEYLEHMAKHLERNASAEFGDGEEDLELKDWLLSERLLVQGRIRGSDGKKGNGREHHHSGGTVPKVKIEKGETIAAGAAVGVRKSPRKTRRAKVEESEEEDAEFD